MTQIKKQTYVEIATFIRKWYAGDRTLRLGQAFLNKYYPSIVDHSLFYEENPAYATEIIYNDYSVDLR